jgi:hypothetical protein
MFRLTDDKVCGEVKAGNGSSDASVPFRGLNVVLFGDLHQFPPVKGCNLPFIAKMTLQKDLLLAVPFFTNLK